MIYGLALGAVLLLAAPTADAETVAKQEVCRAQLRQISTVFSIYRGETNRWPERLADLVPDFLESLPLDPWGTSFRYEPEVGTYHVYSSGADRKPVTADDLVVSQGMVLGGLPEPDLDPTGRVRLHGAVVSRRWAEAKAMSDRVLVAVEAAYGPESPEKALAIVDAATPLLLELDFVRAEPMFRQALAIQRKLNPSDPVRLAATLDHLAWLHAERGEPERANELFAESFAILEKRGIRDTVLFDGLGHHGLALLKRGALVEARDAFTLQLVLAEEIGADDDRKAAATGNLGTAWIALGEPEKAKTLLIRALELHQAEVQLPDGTTEIRRNPFATDAMERDFLGTLSGVQIQLGDLAAARRSLHQALAQGTSFPAAQFGFPPPDEGVGVKTVMLWATLASVELLDSHLDLASDNVRIADQSEQQILRTVLPVCSEAQRQAHLRELAPIDELLLSIDLRLGSAADIDRAAERVLRGKGRAIDGVASALFAMRQNLRPEDAKRLDRLAALRATLAAAELQSRPSPAAVRIEARDLEVALSESSARLALTNSDPLLPAVKKALPTSGALVEFVRFRPFDHERERWTPAHYGAFVVSPEWVERFASASAEPGAKPETALDWIDLGPAEEIDRAILELRRSLSAPGYGRGGVALTAKVGDPLDLARRLDDLLLKPVRAKIGDPEHLFIAPDAELSLVPFAVLRDEENKYLIERSTVSILTSGRELVRDWPVSVTSAPLILGNPTFDSVPGAVSGNGRTSARAAGIRYAPLPGTEQETKAIGALLKGAVVRTGKSASETALKAARAPRVVHVATHGFFLDGSPAENPLLRSGLALSGANGFAGGGGEDGILTALEASSLDLAGTRLVVLSACETGLGDARAGEGLYGMRRALSLAGARNQVLSLWRVSDEGTRDLMIAFYRRVVAGDDVAAALRGAQLELLGSKKRSDPYFWGAFTAGGPGGKVYEGPKK